MGQGASEMEKTIKANAAGRFEVKVWFATSSAPRVIGSSADQDIAVRMAREYLSDARGVWVNDVKIEAR